MNPNRTNARPREAIFYPRELEPDEHLAETFHPLTFADLKPESDPSGKAPNEPGAKLDAGKTMPSLILSAMPRAVMAAAKVGTVGAVKYSRDGWLAVDNGIERYTDAMDRHRLKEFIEGPLDQDFLDQGVEILHAAQVAWNALARLELMLRKQEYDDLGI